MSRALPRTPEQQDDAYMALIPDIEERTSEHYSDELGFHGWHHGLHVAETSLANRSILLGEGVEDISGHFATCVRGLVHDAGMFQFFREGLAKRFLYPEVYSMVIGTHILRASGVDNRTIRETIRPIWGTTCGVGCKDMPSYVLCISDLDNSACVPALYEEFERNTELLRLESKLLKGVEMTPADYDDFSLKLLARYCMINLNQPQILQQSEHLRLLRSRQIATLARFATRRAAESQTSPINFARQLREPAVEQLLAAA